MILLAARANIDLHIGSVRRRRAGTIRRLARATRDLGLSQNIAFNFLHLESPKVKRNSSNKRPKYRTLLMQLIGRAVFTCPE